MRKILPVKEPNDFIAYKPFDASRVEVLLAQETICKELYESFIHFRVEKSTQNGIVHLDCHFNEEFASLGIKKVPIDVLMDLHINFIEFCKTSIDREFYLFIPIETNRISQYSVYKADHVPHHIFVYGYDDAKKVFLCSGFFDFSNGPYRFEEVSYQELEEAFADLQGQVSDDMMENEWAQWLKDIQLLHSFKEYTDKFTIERVRNGLTNYLKERDCYGNKGYIKDVYYVFAIYNLTVQYIESIKDSDEEWFDVRCFALLYFHFRYLKFQAQFIIDNYHDTGNELQPFVRTFGDMERRMDMLKKMALKYRISLRKPILEKLKEELCRIKQEEVSILNAYIKSLESIA